MTNRTRRVGAACAAALALALGTIPAAAQDTADHLARIMEAGVIRMSTDGLYPPQSELTPDGSYVGFDIDVGTEIADRLGVDISFTEPGWEVITAGSWGDRWDFSVGSMNITVPRMEVIDFTQPYYYTPAQLAARSDLGYSSTDDLAGKTICVGAATTYFDWLNGTLEVVSEEPLPEPPEGAVATALETDRLCAEAWLAGRQDFEGWLSSSTTVQQAIDDGLPVVPVGEPFFVESLAVAFDKSVVDNDSLVAAVDAIVGEMHADGTLSALSEKWFGADLTKPQDG